MHVYTGLKVCKVDVLIICVHCCKYGFQSVIIVVSRWLYSADLIGWQCHVRQGKSTCPYATDRKTNISSVLMRFLCKTRHKDSCAWPCLTWHCQPIKSAEYNQRETTIVSDWKPYLQQYTKIIKTQVLSRVSIEDLGFLSRVWEIPSFHEWSVAERVKRRWISLTSGRNSRSSISTDALDKFVSKKLRQPVSSITMGK
jgi:hypothetical protein